MSVLGKLASALDRNDEVPNQLLAKEIAAANDHAAVRELVDNLDNKNRAIQHDCIKVLYEIGTLKPELIGGYVQQFVNLLGSRDNRMIWGSMTALGSVASLKARDLWPHTDAIIRATDHGSAITQDWGIRVLADVAATDATYAEKIVPYLKTFLQKCQPKDLPRHTASIMPIIDSTNRAEIGSLLAARRPELKPAQAARLDQLLRKIQRG